MFLTEATVLGFSVTRNNRSDGALVFKQGIVTYTIQGDRRLKGEDAWSDFDAGSNGRILAKFVFSTQGGLAPPVAASLA